MQTSQCHRRRFMCKFVPWQMSLWWWLRAAAVHRRMLQLQCRFGLKSVFTSRGVFFKTIIRSLLPARSTLINRSKMMLSSVLALRCFQQLCCACSAPIVTCLLAAAGDLRAHVRWCKAVGKMLRARHALSRANRVFCNSWSDAVVHTPLSTTKHCNQTSMQSDPFNRIQLLRHQACNK